MRSVESPQPKRPTDHRWLLALAAGALVWGLAVLETGGFVLEFAGLRLSSTQPARAFGVALAAFVAHYLWAGPRRLGGDLGSAWRSLRGNRLALATLLVGVGLGAVASRACDRPPRHYEPLPLPALSPVVLDDSAEIRAYLNAFPVEEYEQYEVRGLGRFFIDDTTDLIKGTLAAGHIWERHVLDLLEEHVEPGSVVVEVGAHIGSHTVSMARLVGPWGRVYAFEPQRKIYRELHHNLALNGITNVEPLRYAIGSGDARIVEMNPSTPGNEGGTGVGRGGDPVELRTLDSFGFDRVSLVKIDVEGYENAVLDGALDTIRRTRPVIVLEIMGGVDYATASPEARRQIEATWRKLEQLGYRVTPVFQHDYLALPEGPG